MTLELTDEEAAALLRALDGIIEGDPCQRLTCWLRNTAERPKTWTGKKTSLRTPSADY
jgi:hypothetical protein